MTASVTHGRALRYAGGSARGLLHHHGGHYPHRWHAALKWLTSLDDTIRDACFVIDKF